MIEVRLLDLYQLLHDLGVDKDILRHQEALALQLGKALLVYHADPVLLRDALKLVHDVGRIDRLLNKAVDAGFDRRILDIVPVVGR